MQLCIRHLHLASRIGSLTKLGARSSTFLAISRGFRHRSHESVPSAQDNRTFKSSRSQLGNTSTRARSSIVHKMDTAGENAIELRYADIGINLSDHVYQGIYYGKQAHEPDLEQVLARARGAGCKKLMVTGSDLKESQRAVELARQYPGLCYATVGVHPCSAHTFDSFPGGPEALISALRELAVSAREEGLAVAFGEIGLDYDRLELCPKDVQQRYFDAQLDLAVELDMPLFLHSRAAAQDFETALKTRLDRLPRRGCVHSFTGTKEEMQRIVELGFDVGINGCSLKTEENLEVVKDVPLERIQLETDGPWCEIRPSHASAKYLANAPEIPKAVKKEKWTTDCMVKGRNEPCTIGRVAHVVAKVKNLPVEEICAAAWANSTRMFGLGEDK